MRNAYYYKDIKFYFYFIIIWIHAENVEAIITRMAENFILMIPSVVDRHYVFLPLSFIFNYKFSHFALLNSFSLFRSCARFLSRQYRKSVRTQKKESVSKIGWLLFFHDFYFSRVTFLMLLRTKKK